MIGYFAFAVFLLIVTPGPGVLSAAGVGAGFGFAAAARWIWGLYLGNLGVAIIVATGLAGFVLANPTIRVVLLILSSGYLLVLAARVALAGSKIAITSATRAPRVIEAIGLQLLNPKAYVVNTTLISGFEMFPAQFGLELFVKFCVLTAIWYPLHVAYGWAGAQIKTLDLPEHIQRGINITMGLALAAVVVLAIWNAALL